MKRKNNNILVLIVFLLILVSIWFKDHKILATGEEGIVFYNPFRVVEIYKYPWVEMGTGLTMPVYISRIPILWIAAIVSSMTGLPWFSQAIVYFIFLAIGVVSMYLLAKELSSDDIDSSTIALFTSLFYLLNPYSLYQIWQRFLLTGMAGWALTPALLYLSIKYFKTSSLRFLLAINGISLLLSIAFGAPSWIVTCWTPVFVFVLFNRRFLFKLMVIIVSWLACNFWWIVPYISLTGSSFGAQSSVQSNFGTVVSLSKFFTLPNLILLKDSSIIQSDIQKITSVLFLIVALIGTIHHRHKKNWKYLILILALGLFVSKGTNPPIGHFLYEKAFSVLPFTSVFRNPFEKFGLIILLAYSIFYGIGASKLREIKRGLVLIAVVALIPAQAMLDGSIFLNFLKIKVPDYYRDANEYLNSVGSGRIIQFPYSPGEGIRYTWGFRGAESSDFIFNRPSISRLLRADFFDEYFSNLGKHQENPNFPKLLANMSVHDIVYRSDMDAQFVADNKLNITPIRNRGWSFISTSRSFGNLEIISLDEKIKLNRIHVANKVLTASTSSEIMEKILSNDFDIQTTVVTGGYLDRLPSAFDNKLPEISYSTKSPMKYNVNIVDAASPFILVLNNSYNKLWVLRISDQEQLLPFPVNGYANGWLLNKLGSYRVNIELRYLNI